MSLVTIDQSTVAEQREVALKALALPDQARALRVEDSDTLAKANQFFVMAHSLEKEIAKTFKKMKDATYQAWKTVCKEESDAMSPVSTAKAIVKKEIESYAEVQREITAARERAAQEELQRKMESEQLEKAASLEAQGHKELAEEVLAAPIDVPQVTLPTVKEEVTGATFTTTWHWRVEDGKALLQAAAEGKVSFDLKDDEGTTGAATVSIKVGKLLSAMQKDFNLPGCKSWTTSDLKATGRG